MLWPIHSLWEGAIPSGRILRVSMLVWLPRASPLDGVVFRALGIGGFARGVLLRKLPPLIRS